MEGSDPALWSARARELVDGRSFVLVGIGVDQMRVFEALGGLVRGAVSVVPVGGPPSEPCEAYPVLSLTGRVRNIFDFVVVDYATTLMDHAAEVAQLERRGAVALAPRARGRHVVRVRAAHGRGVAATSTL